LKTLQPLIVTARIARLDLEPFERLRRQHFPVDRNFLQAHLTMFNRLPGEYTARIVDALSESVDKTDPIEARVAGVRHLGAGVAFGVASPDLLQIREKLRSTFLPWLGGQDIQKWQPHITVQNKVSRAAADTLHLKLSSEFEPRSIVVEGLELWKYLGGPWQLEHSALFRYAGARNSGLVAHKD
jgi:hypothetical protein